MRSRNIKPSLFANEVLGTTDPYFTILFEGLWCMADREGRLEDRPLKIKGLIFPYRNFNEVKMHEMLNWLAEQNFIQRYQVGQQKLIQVTNFLDNQSPHSTERESELPPQPERNQQDVVAVSDNASLTQVVANSGISGIRNQESGISETLSSLNDVFTYWQKVHDKPRAQFTVERKRRVKERLADSTIDEIKMAIDGCKKSAHHQGQNDRGTVYDDLELICRTRTHLEKFIGYLVKTNGTHSNNRTKPTPGEVIANRPYRNSD